MFAGNLGAVIAGAPLAWLVTQTSWRAVFVGLARAVARARRRDVARRARSARGLGFAPVHRRRRADARRTRTGRARCARVLANPATWPGFFVNVGIGGSYLAFAGLWAVPYLVDTLRHVARRRRAARERCCCWASRSARSSSASLSDRLGNRRGVMRVYALLYALSWLPWLAARAVAAAGDARVVLR